jgi:hypothetical protein
VRKPFDLGPRLEVEHLPKFFGERWAPVGIKRLGVADQLLDAHPAGQIVLFRQVADAGENGDGATIDWKLESSH